MTKRTFKYDKASGKIVEVGKRETRRKGPSLHMRFRPFVSHQIHRATAEALGLPRTRSKGTVFSTEKQLNEYQAHERRHGREAGWKDV